MERRYRYVTFFLLLLASLSLPDTATNSMRDLAVGASSRAWRYAFWLKNQLSSPSQHYSFDADHVTKEMEMIRLENYQLKSKLAFLQSEIQLHQLKEEKLTAYENFSVTSPYLQRRKQELFRQLELYSHAVTARVVFRESSAWKSSIWINVGKSTNQTLQTSLICLNSPVVIGTTAVGIVDFVGEHRSRVRLLTDPSVTASVRVIRGDEQRKMAIEAVRSALLNLADEGKEKHSLALTQFIEGFVHLPPSSDQTFYLAKGELKGPRSTVMKSRSSVLRGIGFNYDFTDEEGAARDLRSGKETLNKQPGICLIQPKDVVVTTGMDSLFPKGLKVGTIKTVYPLEEGQCFYEADIESFIPDFDQITFVTVLPPIIEPEIP